MAEGKKVEESLTEQAYVSKRHAQTEVTTAEIGNLQFLIVQMHKNYRLIIKQLPNAIHVN